MAPEAARLTRARTRVLSRRELNRTLLDRQLLLRRAPMTVEGAVEHLVGLQAQAPRAPYVALWGRLIGFRTEHLEHLLVERRLVRALAMLRTTIHLVTAEDAIDQRAVLQPVAERGFRSGSPYARALGEIDLDEVLAAGREAAADRPLTVPELGAHLARRWRDRDATALAMAVRYLVPMVQPTPRGLWSRGGPPRMVPTAAWLGRPSAPIAAPDRLILRYLRAFGPASAADIATWSWLTGVRAIMERLRSELRTYTDEAGRELFDVPDGAVASPDLPAPPRFLPEYDNVLLSHADRSRIHDPGWKLPLAAGDGARLGTFLVDGFVAGTWRLSLEGDRPLLALDPVTPLARRDSAELLAEAQALVGFIAGSGDGEVRLSQ